MKICVVGAGVAGLLSAKYCLENKHHVTIFEQNNYVGGCWQYTDNVGLYQNGIPVHSAMYENLMTNLPKEIMQLNGLSYKQELKSFIRQTDVLEYLQAYIKKFNLMQYIQCNKQVINIKPLSDNKWIIEVKDTQTKAGELLYFDAVMVCNGHYFHRKMPSILGMKTFLGKQMHSQDYRKPALFKNKSVIIIGAGPSGVDIAKHIASVAKIVYVSHKANSWEVPNLPNLIDKSEVVNIDEHGCTFKDESYATVDIIIYCTGYHYYFPFLSKECGITVDDNWVQYLHNHVINIKYPTMAFIGLLFSTSVFPMMDLMVRYFLSYLSGNFTLPDNEISIRNVIEEQKLKESSGFPRRYAHKCQDHGFKIAKELAIEAKIKPIPNVIFNLHRFIAKARSVDDRFLIVDDENFIKIA